MKNLTTQITDCIERIYDTKGQDFCKKIIIFPVGDVGIQVSTILRNIYSTEPAYLIDNHKCKYSPNIHTLSYLDNLNTKDYILFLASTNTNIYSELKDSISNYFPPENIIELECMLTQRTQTNKQTNKQIKKRPDFKTAIGRYSYGPLCRDHELIESIGSFSGFAPGAEFVSNHEINYITTHPIIFAGKNYEVYDLPYDFFDEKDFYLSGLKPKTELIKKQKRSIIGNDVWLGRNVIVTNSANIGNGVIAAAGAVITKDVPDYAIVAGVPARIIRYRYTPEQIDALNKIAWWNWSDEEIRERFDDFYLPIEEFIKKYI